MADSNRDLRKLGWNGWTWGERAQAALGVCIASAFSVAVFIGALWLIGSGVETIAKHSEDRDQCLKQATNGYEIERCR